MRSAALPRFSSKFPGFISYVILRRSPTINLPVISNSKFLGRNLLKGMLGQMTFGCVALKGGQSQQTNT